MLAAVPWIGIFPAESQASARSGFYAVYLFASDGSAVFLSLNQGTEKVRGGTKPIEKRALDLRRAARLPAEASNEIDLASNARLPKKYEAGSAYAIGYAAGEVPGAERLDADLSAVLGYVEQAQDSGLEFDPELEPLHLVFKWAADYEART